MMHAGVLESIPTVLSREPGVSKVKYIILIEYTDSTIPRTGSIKGKLFNTNGEYTNSTIPRIGSIKGTIYNTTREYTNSTIPRTGSIKGKIYNAATLGYQT